MTSLVLSLFRARRTAWRWSMEKVEEGKRYDVIITYCASRLALMHTLKERRFIDRIRGILNSPYLRPDQSTLRHSSR